MKKGTKKARKSMYGRKSASTDMEVRRKRQMWIWGKMEKGQSCAEIGKELGISRQRVHKIAQHRVCRSGSPEAKAINGDGWAVNFGYRLRKARHSAGLTVSEAATEIGKSLPYLSSVERGKGLCDVTTLPDMALLYGVAVANLWPRVRIKVGHKCYADGVACAANIMGKPPTEFLQRIDAAMALPRDTVSFSQSGKGTWCERLGQGLLDRRQRREMFSHGAVCGTGLTERALLAVEKGDARIDMIPLTRILRRLGSCLADIWPEATSGGLSAHRLTVQGLAYLEAKLPGVKPGELLELLT